MFRSGKYKHFQNRRDYSDDELKTIYKWSTTSPGERVAITRELNARAGKTPLHSPQVNRQRIVQWSMLNAKNTAGMLLHNRYRLAAVSRELGDADKLKALKMAQMMYDAAQILEAMVAYSKVVYPSKKTKKEKENA